MFAPEHSISNRCPSSEWESIQQYLAEAKNDIPEKYQALYRQTVVPNAITLNGKNSQRLLYIDEDDFHEPKIAPRISTTPMAAVADAITTTSDLWSLSLFNVTTQSGHGSPLSDQSAAFQYLTGDSLQGFTAGTCVPEMVFNRTDNRPLALPFLYYANARPDSNITFENFTMPAIVHPNITRDQVLGVSNNESQYFIQWIQLPQKKFNGSSIGAAILLPETQYSSQEQNGPQIMILCNFAAGWGRTSLQKNIAENANDDRVSSKVISNQNWNDEHPMVGPGLISESDEALVYWNYPQYPQKPISIAQSWAQSLNPMVQSANKTVFQLIMQEKPDLPGGVNIWGSASTFKDALTLMISNGLGRVGFDSILQGDPKSTTSPDGTSWIDGNYWLSGKGVVFKVDLEDANRWLKFHVDSKLKGYAYNTQTVSPRLAIAVMIAYCVIALAHLLYSGITGKFLDTLVRILIEYISCIAADTLLVHRDNLHMLGLHHRAHRPRRELGSHRGLAQHLRWDQGAPHLPASRTHCGGT